jgi:broad specificity polyphosphatase/5'/3'-nucleotidase SurE
MDSVNIPDLYNINVHLDIAAALVETSSQDPSKVSSPPVMFTQFMKGGYKSLYKQRKSNDRPENGAPENETEFYFSPQFPSTEEALYGTDQWALFNGCFTVTPMKAQYATVNLEKDVKDMVLDSFVRSAL